MFSSSPTIFYYPKGKPLSSDENETTLSTIKQLFNSRPHGRCRLKHFAEISKAFGLPAYSRKAVYEAVCQCSNLPPSAFPDVSFEMFAVYWEEMIKENHDEVSRFFFTLSVARTGLPSRSYLERENFLSILNDINQTHPGLDFSARNSEDNSAIFRARYTEMVLTRIFWNCSRAWWTGRLTAEQLRKSNLLESMHQLESCGRKLPECFSYEQFYVVYSKFHELDEDHDMKLSREDLKKYSNSAPDDEMVVEKSSKGTLNHLAVERIFSNVLRQKKLISRDNGPPSKQQNKQETIGFEEFAAFLMAEEDKRHPTAIEYWFRCLDLDGDGIISLYEIEAFYNGMVAEFSLLEMVEPPMFHNLATQLYHIVSPRDGKNIRLCDIKQCGLAHHFFDSLINSAKYLNWEFNESKRYTTKMIDGKVVSDWEHFCTLEYLMMSLKEKEKELEESIEREESLL